MHATEQVYSLGIDSARLNPWVHRVCCLLIDYPDVLLALERVVRQMRRIAYTLNESESSWTEIVQKQGWALDYAHLLKEIGSILASAVGYIRPPTTTQSNGLPDREDLSTYMEQAQQQLRIWQAQLAQDAKQIESQDEKADSPSVSAGQRIAIRGAILTDLRRMLDEVFDVVAMVSHPSLSEQVEGLSTKRS